MKNKNYEFYLSSGQISQLISAYGVSCKEKTENRPNKVILTVEHPSKNIEITEDEFKEICDKLDESISISGRWHASEKELIEALFGGKK